MTREWWQVEWQVPANNAVGGQAYWASFQDDDGNTRFDEANARASYTLALRNHPEDRIRLVRVAKEVVMEHRP